MVSPSLRELVYSVKSILEYFLFIFSYMPIDDFQELKSVVDDFNGGESSHVIEVNNSFGMGLSKYALNICVIQI